MAIVNDSLTSSIKDLGLGEKPEVKKDRNNLGQEDFLNLMIAEIQNQDPFKPVENSDFVAQMAQFSSVSGLADLKSSFTQLATNLTSNQALQASTMVGRSVLISSSDAPLNESREVTGAVSLKESSLNVIVNVLNEAGEPVRSLSLGPQAAGDIKFRWDGLASDGTVMPQGRYRLAAEANGFDKNTSLETFVNADVESVTLNQQTQGVTLNLKDLGSTSFSAVREIK